MAQTMLIERLPFTHILKCNIFGESNRFLENGIQCPQLLRVQALATVLMVPVESTGTGLNEFIPHKLNATQFQCEYMPTKTKHCTNFISIFCSSYNLLTKLNTSFCPYHLNILLQLRFCLPSWTQRLFFYRFHLFTQTTNLNIPIQLQFFVYQAEHKDYLSVPIETQTTNWNILLQLQFCVPSWKWRLPFFPYLLFHLNNKIKSLLQLQFCLPLKIKIIFLSLFLSIIWSKQQL